MTSEARVYHIDIYIHVITLCAYDRKTGYSFNTLLLCGDPDNTPGVLSVF